jgi:hypothetical protein
MIFSFLVDFLRNRELQLINMCELVSKVENFQKKHKINQIKVSTYDLRKKKIKTNFKHRSVIFQCEKTFQVFSFHFLFLQHLNQFNEKVKQNE